MGPVTIRTRRTSAPTIRKLAVVTKYPTPGRVKTRMIPVMGEDCAAEEFGRMLTIVMQNLSDRGQRRTVHLDPPRDVSRMKEFLSERGLSDAFDVHPQPFGNLGRRLRTVFAEGPSAVTTRDDRTLVVGGDCPTIEAADADDAWQSLADHDVVIGPTYDGGYWLIGMRGPWDHRRATLFEDIPWSTHRVVAETKQRIRSAGLSLAVLDRKEDIDDETAWLRWVETQL